MAHVEPQTTETDWKARALEAERKANEAWDAYHRLAAQQADAHFYRNALEQQEESLSWKVTAPLRFAKRVVVVLMRLFKQFTSR